MKYRFLFLMGVVTITSASAAMAQENPFEIKITSMSNTPKNAAIEVCGTATHRDGAWPLMVTVLHDESSYSTLTAPDSRWCTLIKRWTFSGKVDVQAATLDGKQKSTNEEFSLKEGV